MKLEELPKNTYIIKPKFEIGETVEIIKPPYPSVKYFRVVCIEPTITKSGVEIYYMGNSWVHYYHENQLKKIEKDSK